MLKSCPDSIEVSDLQFKLQCRLKIFENQNVSSFPNTISLLTCASRYGLLFVGSNSNHFQAVQTQVLHSYSTKGKDIVDYPKRNVQLPSTATHLCVNCDNTILAVVVEKDQCPVVIFYEVLSFVRQNENIIKEIRLSSTPNVYVREVNWNPSHPTIFTACKSDGSLGVYELKGDSVDFNELPSAAGATCFCWSPKGKQIAVGSKDGKITQYKPDLKAVKAIGEPKLEGPHTIINLLWVSNYQFIGVYQSVQDAASLIIVVDAPKTGEPTYTNYEDICYSSSSRLAQFYLILQQTWNVLMVASSNSTEVGVLGSNGDLWTQWTMTDTARAELPLSQDHQETLPVGLTFDISSTAPLPWGESSIPPCPLLCILSHQGVLCCFNVVYLKEGIPSVCTPPDPVGDTSGLNTFVASPINIVETAPPKLQQQLVSPEVKFQLPSTPVKNGTFSFPASTIALNIPSQSTPLITAKNPSDVASKTLFGGQATLTPIKPQEPSQGLPLFGGQSLITPISKLPISTGQTTKFSSDKYASLFSSINSTSSPQTNTAPAIKPIVISSAAVKPQVVQRPSETTVPSAQEIAPVAKQDSNLVDSKAETSAMLAQMTKDEWMYLETELKVLINLGRTVKVNVGTDNEKVNMIEQIASLEEFVTEAVDISVGQSKEIHCLKQNLIQSWAWFEEAKSHYNSSKNEAIVLLIKVQPLDSLSQKRLKDIEQLIYYVESQLCQASKTLDEQWDSFQDFAKKTYKVKMPTMEAIFQTMVRHSAILQRQTYVLKDISLRLRKKKSNISSLLLSLDEGRDLADDLQELSLDSRDILQLQYDRIKNRTNSLTEAKASKLRKLLGQRKVTRVTAVKPHLSSSWTISQSPTSRMRQSISKLGTSMSPVARNLEFAQTPPAKVSSPIQPNQGFSFSLKTPEKPIFAATSNAPSSFVPLVKSGPVISSSQGSAFTPIGGAAISDNQQLFKSTMSPMPSFSFGGATKGTAPAVSQVPPTFSSQSLIGPSTTTADTSTISSNVNSPFKSAADTATVKPQSVPASNTFAFGSSSSAIPKSVFGTPPNTTSNLPFSSASSSNSFQFQTTTSGAAFGSSTKPNVFAPAAVSTGLSAQQPDLGPISKAITTAAGSVPPTAAKPISGVASIFANLQSVINKATGSTSVSTSINDIKPISTMAFSSPSTTTVTKPLFGSDPGSSFFGNTTKPAADSAVPSATQSLFGIVSDSSGSSSIFGEPTKPSEAAFSLPRSEKTFEPKTSVVDTKGEPSTPSNVITVSLFGAKPVTSEPVQAASIFGSTTAAPSVSQPGLNIFGNLAISNTTAQTAVPLTTASVFGTSEPTAPSPTNVATKPSIFGSPGSIFASSASSSAPTTTSNIFATTSTSPGASVGSIFGSAPSAGGAGIFGTPTTSIFGSPTSGKSIFGSAAAAVTTTAPEVRFGAPPTTVASAFQASEASTAVFGTPTNVFETAAAKTTNIFGSPSTGGSIFGAAPSSTTANIFASSPATTSPASIFGSTTPVTTTSSSAFGGPATSNQPPFGSQSGSMFGAANTTGSVFGQTSASSGSQAAFGGAPATTASSIFGQPPVFGSGSGTTTFGSTTTTSGSIFGSAVSSNTGFGAGFGAPPLANVFGSSVAAQPATESFGFGTLNVGSTPASSNIFSGSSGGAFSSPSVFGATSFSQQKQPAFGQPAAFGSTAFGSPQPGVFSGGNTSPVAQSGFGSSANFQKPSGFGSAPVFGGSPAPAFGSPPSFGGSANFGAVPAFGSPEKVFGSNQPASGAFAAGPPQSPGFGNLASQNTIGFGNLAQQANTPTSMPFSGNSSFSSWR